MIAKFLVFLGLSAIVFFPALRGGYLYWDDTTHIINNPNLVAGNWMEFWVGEYYRLYIPVIYTVWTWLFFITDAAWIYHLFNLILHAANGVMFFALAGLAVPAASKRALWLATLAYLLHPLQTEPVAWVAGGRDLLSTTFAFASMLTLWRYANWTGYFGSTVLFLLSLLSKATTAPLPVALLLIPAFRKTMTTAKWVCLGVWLGSAVVVLYINKMVQQAEADNLIKPLSVIDRALTVIDIFGFYIQKFFAPWPVASDYGRIPYLILENKMYWLTGTLFIGAWAVILAAKYFKRDFPIWGFLFFGVIMSPVSGVVTFMAQSQSSVADRYVYFAWAGPCMLLAMAATKYRMLQPVIFVVTMIWAGLCFERSSVYVNNQSFFPDMLTYNPDSFVGHTTMGVVDFSAGRMDLAEKHFKDASRIMPLSVSPIGNLAQLYLEQRRMADIIKDVQPVYEQPGFLEFNKSNLSSVARCARVLARAHMALGRLDEANRKLCQARELDPDDPDSKTDYYNFVMEMQKRQLPVKPCS